MADMVLMTPVVLYLCLNGLILECLDAQVHLVLIWVTSTQEPHVGVGVLWVLSEIEEGGGIKVIRIWCGAPSPKAVDSGVVSVLHPCELGRPDVPIWTPDWHWHELVN
jgi:hypothetical protein